MTIDEYMDRARLRGFSSDNQLAKGLGITSAGISAWRQKKSWPADETMLRLAELAGVDAERALVDLNTWRAKSPAVAAMYSRLADKILRAAGGSSVIGFLLVALLGASPASAGTSGQHFYRDAGAIYIMRISDQRVRQ